MKTIVKLTAAAAILGVLGACAGNEAKTTTAPAAQPSAAIVEPQVDRAGAQSLLSPDETLEVVTFAPGGSTSVSGTVEGYKSKAYAVPVAAGQTLTVTFEPSNTNLYMNIHDTKDQSGAAVHGGETDGPRAALTADADLTYLIRPFQPRATARRGETGTYTIQLVRN